MDKSVDISQLISAVGGRMWFTVKAAAIVMTNNGYAIIKRRNDLARQRYQLTNMDDEQLRDIGISRDLAEKEAARPVWDDPLAAPEERQVSNQIIEKRRQLEAK